MKIYKEMSLRDFEPWAGAVERFNDAGSREVLDEIEELFEDFYGPYGFMSETDVNDWFWFEYDEWLVEMGYEEDPE